MVGAGYTGGRVWERLSGERRLKITRRGNGADSLCIDLDAADIAPLQLPPESRLLYTVPPPAAGERDDRMAAWLAALANSPARLVYLSTTGVYGDAGGAVVDESRLPAPATDRARRRVDAERQLAAWSASSGSDLVILRVPAIYGPGRLGLDRLRAGEPVLVEAEATPGNRIHVDDLVEACLAALQGDAPAGIYNVGDGDHRSASAFSRLVAELAGLAEPLEITLAEAKRQWSPGRLSFLAESRRVDTRRMRDLLGVTPRYADVAEGIRASLG